MFAYTLAIVPYVVSIKRLSALFVVIFGWLLLKEQGFRQRLLGVGIMVLGAGMIALA